MGSNFTQFEKETKKALFSPFALAIMIVIIFVLSSFLLQPNITYLKVNFFDVGQGDSALISTPNNQFVLIDGGPNSAVLSKLDKEVPVYHHTIDAIILTHPHADHLDGLNDVLKKYEVRNIYATGVIYTTPEYLELLSLVKEKKIPFKIVVSGDSLDLGDETKVEFLYPIKNLAETKPENLNNSSIVAKLIYGKSKVIFMGDLEAEAQNEITNNNSDVSAQIIKIAHHGSIDSLNPDFLAKVGAKYAVISVGKDNKFGHPSSKVLNYLNGTKVYRTDQEGNVIFNLTKTEIIPEKP